MFGFGKKKAPPPPPREKRQRTSVKTKEQYKDELEKLGILGLGMNDDSNLDSSLNDSDSEIDEANLEDELLALVGGEDGGSTDMLLPSEPKSTKPEHFAPEQPPPPELEAIYNAPPPPASVSEALDQRLLKYKSELDKATAAGEGTSKLRRLGRIVKQYEEAIRDYKKGKSVDFSELPSPPGFGPIPASAASTPKHQQLPASESASTSKNDEFSSLPPVINHVPQQPPQLQTPLTPEKIEHLIPTAHETVETEVELEPLVKFLKERQQHFKETALESKKSGDIEQAKENLRMSKGIEKMIQDKQAGVPIDLDNLRSLGYKGPELENEDPKIEADLQNELSALTVDNDMNSSESMPEPSQTQTPAHLPEEVNLEDLMKGPPPPATISEALDQRLVKYKFELEKATTAGEASSKLRRLGRIVKQYEEAIRDYKKGKHVEFAELPTPPGFAPIPIPGVSATPISDSAPSQVHGGGSPSDNPSESVAGVSPSQRGSVNRGANKPQTKLTLQEKQLSQILHRQKLFKDAAINAKKRGDIDQAKEFLKNAKGFDKLIQASEAGLPVDMATLPSPPEAVKALNLETSDDFELVGSSDCLPPPEGSTAEIFTKLEQDLREQMKMCMKTRDHFRSMGDIASANRFEKLAIETKKDLDTLRVSGKTSQELPKFRYETRIFSITECNSDLADDEIEISVLKGINYKVTNPTDVDTFVKVELPYPSAEEAQTNKTNVIRDTNNPDYEATYKMKINRSARPFPRFIHRHGFKLEVWSKGGFLRSSTMLGLATVKLLPLETKCTLHDAFDILDGRKSVGKIEVKVRIREPVLTKQISQRKEKWLSIDRT